MKGEKNETFHGRQYWDKVDILYYIAKRLALLAAPVACVEIWGTASSCASLLKRDIHF